MQYWPVSDCHCTAQVIDHRDGMALLFSTYIVCESVRIHPSQRQECTAWARATYTHPHVSIDMQVTERKSADTTEVPCELFCFAAASTIFLVLPVTGTMNGRWYNPHGRKKSTRHHFACRPSPVPCCRRRTWFVRIPVRTCTYQKQHKWENVWVMIKCLPVAKRHAPVKS